MGGGREESQFMQQTNFFDLIGTDENSIEVSVFDEGDHYRATIAGGWWSARGKTKSEAVKNVLAAYEKEINGL